MNELVDTILLGTGATAVTDLWGLARRPLLGMPPPDYSMVGRWIGGMTKGNFRHSSMAAAARVEGERAIGWVFHYFTGVAFAALLVLGTAGTWLHEPTLRGAMLTGIGTVAAPFLLMQPAMGAGFAASRTPRPDQARLQALVTHAVFGVGLFLTGELLGALRASGAWQ